MDIIYFGIYCYPTILSLFKKIIESSPPPRKKAENKVRDVYTKTVKNRKVSSSNSF